MERTLPTVLRRLARDQRGTSVIEMGLAAPVLAVLLMGMIDLGRGLSERFTIQQAVNRSLEMIQAKRPQAGADDSQVDYTFLKTEAATAAGVPASQVTLTQWLECNGTRKTNYDDSCADSEDTARYLQLQINKNFVGSLYLGTVPMTAKGVLRTQ
jgi:Flp pilus assembly protein TadG